MAKKKTSARKKPTSKAEWQIKAETLQNMVEHLPAGSVYVANNQISLNKAAETITGYDRVELKTLDDWFEKLYGDDSTRLRQIYNTSRLTGFAKKTPPQTITRKDGGERLVEFAAYKFDDHEVWLIYDVTERYQAERELRISEDRLRAILNTAADAILTLNQEGVIGSTNPATEQLFGYQQDEILGQNISKLMPMTRRKKEFHDIASYLHTDREERFGNSREITLQRKDGSIFPADLTINEIDHLNIYTVIIHDITLRKELERQVLEIAAEEDQRIGIELHDNIQQQLTGLGLMANSIANRLGVKDKTETNLSQIDDMMNNLIEGINKSVKQVQLLSRGLIPVQIDALGLRAALTDLASSINQQYGVQCTFHSEGKIEISDNFIATHLYRIAQEAITNAINHSQSEHIDISLTSNKQKLKLKVVDDGVGIDKTAFSGSGMGLHLMEHRASLIGASLHIGQTNDGGTEIVCIVMV